MTADEQAISTMISQLQAAWNAGDSAGFAKYFTDDASFIHIYGAQVDGRAAIEPLHRQIFDTVYKSSHNEYTILAIKFVRPDVAIAYIRAHLRYFEAGEPREIHARPTMVAVKNNGQWEIAAFQNTRISEMPAIVKAAGN